MPRYLPRHDRLVTDGRPAPVFDRFWRDLVNVPEWVKTAEQQTLDAALAATVIARAPVASPASTVAPGAPTTTPTGPGALYKFSYYARIVVPADVSSSVTITIRWTDGGVAQSHTFPAITGNTTDTVQISVELLLRVDPGTEVTIETAYTSVGATPAAYDVVPSVEEVPVVATRPRAAA